jgi:hypothetical protein
MYGQLRVWRAVTAFGGRASSGGSDSGSGLERFPEEVAELGGVRGEAGVPAGEVLEFRAEVLGQEGGRTVRQLAA